MQERRIDVDKAQVILRIVEEWGQRPEVREKLDKAMDSASNSLMGLILTGIESGEFVDNPISNQRVLGKLSIAFQLGYYFRSVEGS